MNAQEYASKVANFIKHNNIDTDKYSMEIIVREYTKAQIEALDNLTADDVENIIELGRG